MSDTANLILAEAQDLQKQVRWLEGQGVTAQEAEVLRRALVEVEQAGRALERLAWAGMSGPPVNADRSGAPCPNHVPPPCPSGYNCTLCGAWVQFGGSHTCSKGQAQAAEPTCSVCGAPARAFRGGKHFCKDCGR
jgi:hypothetical protein